MSSARAACAGTLAEALTRGAKRLGVAGVENPRREARVLMAAALNCEVSSVFAWPEQPLDEQASARFLAMVAARVGGKPISRILGRREFWSLPFALNESTLDPRPESETLVRAVLEKLRGGAPSPRILDLGTGTGCLLLALLHELPQARGVGVDICESAVRMARRNAAELGLEVRTRFLVGDWANALTGGFDVVVCNPPYIAGRDKKALPPEVVDHDPPTALFAGADGLGAYRALAPEFARILAPGGFAAIEVGAGQADAVMALMRAAGLRTPPPICDLAGIVRCVVTTLDEP